MSQSPHQLMFNLYNIIALTGEHRKCGQDDDDGGHNNDNDSDDEIDLMIIVKVTSNGAYLKLRFSTLRDQGLRHATVLLYDAQDIWKGKTS